MTGQVAAGTQTAATAAAGPSAGALLGDTGKTKNSFKKSQCPLRNKQVF